MRVRRARRPGLNFRRDGREGRGSATVIQRVDIGNARIERAARPRGLDRRRTSGEERENEEQPAEAGHDAHGESSIAFVSKARGRTLHAARAIHEAVVDLSNNSV